MDSSTIPEPRKASFAGRLPLDERPIVSPPRPWPRLLLRSARRYGGGRGVSWNLPLLDTFFQENEKMGLLGLSAGRFYGFSAPCAGS